MHAENGWLLAAILYEHGQTDLLLAHDAQTVASRPEFVHLYSDAAHADARTSVQGPCLCSSLQLQPRKSHEEGEEAGWEES